VHAELPAGLPPNLLAVLMKGASPPMRDTALELEIEITQGHCVGGDLGDVYPGDRLRAPAQLTIAEARAKVRDRLARLIDERLPAAAPAAPAAEVVETRDPAIETRDPLITSAAVPPAAEGVQTSAQTDEAPAAAGAKPRETHGRQAGRRGKK